MGSRGGLNVVESIPEPTRIRTAAPRSPAHTTTDSSHSSGPVSLISLRSECVSKAITKAVTGWEDKHWWKMKRRDEGKKT